MNIIKEITSRTVIFKNSSICGLWSDLQSVHITGIKALLKNSSPGKKIIYTSNHLTKANIFTIIFFHVMFSSDHIIVF